MRTIEKGEAAHIPDFRSLAEEHMEEGGLFVYESEVFERAASRLLNLDAPYGLTVRYAAKANPNSEILRNFDNMGLHFDASSIREAKRLLEAGVEGKKISLSSQVLPEGGALETVLGQGVLAVATSLRQLDMLGKKATPNYQYV